MDRLKALKYFCTAAETLQFRETALRMSVSPQVVTRIIAELEDSLGEALFVRNTRNIQLTDFGMNFLPRAQQLLHESEMLFSTRAAQEDMRGMVRITLPKLTHNATILSKLLARCEDYPELVIDWRVDTARLDSVTHQIDMGVRIGPQPDDMVIARKICDYTDRIVAAPALLARYGVPKSLEELLDRFPVSSLINVGTNRSWGWPFRGGLHVFPKRARLVTDDNENELAAALAGYLCTYIPDELCHAHLASGALVELFPEIPRTPWQMYLYRPQRTVTSPRVLAVFDWMTEILREEYGA